MTDIALVLALVFAVNLLPAFGPPTWAVLVGLHFALDVHPVALVAAGAVGAACGRWALAHAAWLLRRRLSDERRASLEALRAAVEDRPAGALAGLALLALSPLPSAQLFVAAGLTGARIVPLVLAFFAGRLVSCSLYVGAAEATREKLGDSLLDGLRSPAGIALQVAMLAMLVVLVKVDWRRVLAHRRTPTAEPNRTPA